jgi:RNA polymerase sigma-70 factor, ECF subfamily
VTTHSSANAFSAADEASVIVAAAGDRGAFEELLRRRYPPTRNLLRRLCRSTTLADDLAQNTFLQAWKKIHHLRSPNAFSGWLRQLAVNTWLQHLRSTDIFTNLDVAYESTSLSLPDMVLDLNSALSTLEPTVRLCVVLSYHEGLSHSEIATVTKIPLGTVKSHVSRGAIRLRELLSAYDPSHERASNVS